MTATTLPANRPTVVGGPFPGAGTLAGATLPAVVARPARERERRDPVRLRPTPTGDYTLRLAQDRAEVEAVQRLRYEVFNLELGEGLESSHALGRDADAFDPVCDHLVVEHAPSGRVVGTYRLQTGRNAAAHRGYYSEQEFAFEPFEPRRDELIELGRACVHRSHRNLVVLGLLWQGIGRYARSRGGRYLLGCSSLTSQDAAVGAAAFRELRERHLAPPDWRTIPHPEFVCPVESPAAEAPPIPKLLRAYLALGARICGPPAIDREFKTIDFLTWLDLEDLPAAVRSRFLG